jgi:hypothetical protein
MKRDSSVVTFPFRLPMKINKLASTVIATVVCASFVQLAPAAVIVTTSQSFWNSYSASNGTFVSTETFNNLSGIYTAPVSGTAGSTAWTASAAQGLFAIAGLFQSNAPETMTFSFSPGVQGVSAFVFATDTTQNSAPSIMEVTLSDGSTYIGYSTSINDFLGFYSTGAAITGLTISATQAPGGPVVVYPTVDTMYFATIPAPGAIALLGLAGLVARRRRN